MVFSSLNGVQKDPSSDSFMNVQWTEWIGYVKGEEYPAPKIPGLYRIRFKDTKTPFSFGACEEQLYWHINRRLIGHEGKYPVVAAEVVERYLKKGHNLECSYCPIADNGGYDTRSIYFRSMGVLMHHFYREKYGRSAIFGYFMNFTKESLPPLKDVGSAGDQDWMGLEWTPFIPLKGSEGTLRPKGAVYILKEGDEIIHIGSTSKASFGKTRWSKYGKEDMQVSVSYTDEKGQHINEMLIDLLSSYILENDRPPKMQFANPYSYNLLL